VKWVINFTSSVQVSGFGCQVSATEVDPLGRSRSWSRLSFIGVGLQLQPNQCSGFRIRFLL